MYRIRGHRRLDRETLRLSIKHSLTSTTQEVSIDGKITFNNEQLEFLKFIVQDFEYNDDHEKYMIDQITNKIYDAQEHQLLIDQLL